MVHEIGEMITAKTIAERETKNIRTIAARWAKLYEGISFDANAVLSPEQIAALSRPAKETKGEKTRPEKETPPPVPVRIVHVQAVPPQPAPAAETEPPKKESAWRRPLLILLLIAPTLASTKNMFQVADQLTDAFSAVLLTVVLSLTALGFVLAGVRSWLTIALAVLLIAYESMCNLVRIYAGLFAVSGNPTRFLSQFCEVFNAGNHGSAIALAGATAFFIAAVQYSAVYELNKK